MMASQALAHPTAQAWPSAVLPATLRSHGLRCRDETPASARRLVAEGQLRAEDFIETSPEIERTLMEAFIEDDYEGKLHLTTLTMAGGDGNEEIAGMSFWREVPSGEMEDWMDMKRISKAIRDKRLTSHSGSDDEHRDLSHVARKKMRLVRSDSLTWIESALQPCNNNDSSDTPRGVDAPSESTMHKLTHSWIKIELIAVKRTHRAHHLGHLLLGCTLAKAHALHHNEHAILHIAGGGASKNVPAARLYARYGFLSIPRHEEGGPFGKPDRDLFVLGNIGRALGALPWEELLQIESATEGNEGGGEVKESWVRGSCPTPLKLINVDCWRRWKTRKAKRRSASYVEVKAHHNLQRTMADNQHQAKLHPAADVLRDQLLLEVDKENAATRDENRRLQPARDLLGAVELRLSRGLVVSTSIEQSAIVKKSNGVSYLVSFVNCDPLPLADFRGGGVCMSGQTVGTFPAEEDARFFELDEETESVRMRIPVSRHVLVEGDAQGLSNDELIRLRSSSVYEEHGLQAHVSNSIIFTPTAVQMIITDQFRETIRLFGALPLFDGDEDDGLTEPLAPDPSYCIECPPADEARQAIIEALGGCTHVHWTCSTITQT